VTPTAPHTERARGIGFAFAAYGMWGLLPLYFIILAPTGPFEIVAWRIVFSLVFCAILVTATRAWRALLAIVRQPRLLMLMALASVLIYVNWQTFVLGTLSGQVIQTSLGYFMNPIVTVLLGVIFLRERLTVAQWIAVGISIVAVLVIALNYGSFPWIAVVLAFSFSLYGFVKKRVGAKVDALSGLALETAWLVPVAVVQLIVVSLTAGLVIGTAGPGNTVLLVGVGIATAIPLLFFAGAARRLPLVTIGLIQYATPIIQFLLGFFVLGENMPATRWIGFCLIWVALIILSIDLVRRARAGRRVALQPA
jgi:chloramphenicol-sensitive protein RarD